MLNVNWQILKRHYSCLGVIIPMTLVVVRDFYPYVWHIHPSDWKCVIWCGLMIPITVLPTTTTTPRRAQPSWSLFWPLFSLPKDESLSPTDFTHCPTPIWGHQSHMWLLFEHMTEKGGAFASKPTQSLMKILYVTKHDLHIYPVNILVPY